MQTLSIQTMKNLRAFLRSGQLSIEAQRDALAELERALSKKSRIPPRKRTAKRDGEWLALMKKVKERSGGRCEFVTELSGRCVQPATEGHHVFGRLEQDYRKTLHLCSADHRWATNSKRPEVVWRYVALSLELLGFATEARRARGKAEYLAAKSSLPAAPGQGKD